MWVKKIQLRNFRNYSEIDLDFEKGINFFQGNNGSGKTSLVEAIGMLALCKSIRTNDDKEMIKVDNESCVIISQLENEIDREYRIVISKEGKFVWLDGNEIKIEKNCAIINFSNEILNYKDENEKLKIINSIVNTLTNLKEINSIKILVNGSENENFSDEYLRTK